MIVSKHTHIDSKGRMTVPAEHRTELDFKPGDLLQVEVRGRYLVMRRVDGEDWTAGALFGYAEPVYLTPEEIREAAKVAIAEQVMAELEEIDRHLKGQKEA